VWLLPLLLLLPRAPSSWSPALVARRNWVAVAERGLVGLLVLLCASRRWECEALLEAVVDDRAEERVEREERWERWDRSVSDADLLPAAEDDADAADQRDAAETLAIICCLLSLVVVAGCFVLPSFLLAPLALSHYS